MSAHPSHEAPSETSSWTESGTVHTVRVGAEAGSSNLGSIPPQLSPQVLAGLHEVARCVDAGNFERGLEVHAQVAGCSSFSEVSSFMPVLKAVLTIAHRLQG